MSTKKSRIARLFLKKKKSDTKQNQSGDEYKTKISRHRKRLLKRVLIIAGVIIIGTLVTKTVMDRWKYKSYKVISESHSEDTVSTKYVELNGSVLKYSADGATLVNSSGKAIWNQTYEMEAPTVDVCGSTAVVYAEKGTGMVMLGESGKIGQATTEMPILKARVASGGGVAAILEDGENTWINYYSAKGEQIAAAKTRVDSPGYPVDISLSNDGMLLMVTYLYVENGTSTSYIAFYNFGNAGQNQMDNMVSGYTYSGILVPQVAYLNETTSVAFRDDGFVLYEGKQIPKESSTVTVENEIISTFYSSKYVGMVFRSDETDKQYTLQLYSAAGKLVFERAFNIEYNEIKISGDAVLMNNDSQLCVISLKGVEKFNGTLDEGSIFSIFKTDANRYQLVGESGIKTIKLK